MESNTNDDRWGQRDVRACGNHHPLPCGVDVKCPVPPSYFNAEMTDEEIVTMYDKNDNSGEL